MQELFRLKTVDRLRGLADPLGYRSRLSGGVPADGLPPTLRRIRLGHAQLRGLSGGTCTDGKYFSEDGRELDFIDAINACGRAKGWINTPFGLSQMISGADKYRAEGRAGISDRIWNAVMACGHRAMCSLRADRVTAAALAERDRINAEIAANTEAGNPPVEYGGPAAQVNYTGRNPGGEDVINNGTGGGGGGVYQTGGGTSPFSGIDQYVPDALKSDSGEVNWLLIAAVAAGTYFMVKKR